MLLADGRRIVRDAGLIACGEPKSNVIPLHPGFKMFVLANRPGMRNHVMVFGCRPPYPLLRIRYMVLDVSNYRENVNAHEHFSSGYPFLGNDFFRECGYVRSYTVAVEPGFVFSTESTNNVAAVKDIFLGAM